MITRSARKSCIKSRLAHAAVCLLALADVSALAAQDAPKKELTSAQLTALQRADEVHLRQLHSSLRAPLRASMAELRALGWPAQISRGARALADQRRGFLAGHSKTLRSKHLCGKAADINLHPHRFPHAEHPFWDAKDRVVRARGLQVLDVPSFRDRPHVELLSDCDWDALKMGPVGVWVDQESELERATLRITRSSGTYGGAWVVERPGEPLRRASIERVQVDYQYSEARNRKERVVVRVHLEGAPTLRFTVSTLLSPAHGYERATWEALEQAGSARSLVRQSP